MLAKPDPLSVQLAIQGGGAKICLLLAAMEALQSLEANNILKVTRVAGTSAGAIVGCLFAANVDMKLVRQRLKGFSPQQLAKMFPAPGLNIVTRLCRGLPLWKTEMLASELRQYFEDQSVHTLGELAAKKGVEALVVAANLTESRKVVYREPTKDIVEALLDSCGLPYCFRTWSKSGSPTIVDGGICENLPSDELEQYEAQDGPVVGISFDPVRGRTPNTFKDFSIALLDTAMNNSMARAKLRLGANRVFSIKTEIGTFDFEEAIERGLDTDYELIKDRAHEWFKEFAASKHKKQHIIGDVWKDQNISIMNKLSEIYVGQHKLQKLDYRHCSFVVQANCLAGEGAPPDNVTYSVSFRSLNNPVYCHGIQLSETEHERAVDQTEFSVFDDATGNTINTRSMPMREPSRPTGRGLLLFFLPVLPINSGPYTIQVRDVVLDFMEPLRETYKDELVVAPLRAASSIGKIDLVLHWPKDKGTVLMMPKESASVGRKMNAGELSRFAPPQVGFLTIGWTGENVDPDREFGVDLVFKPSDIQ